MENKNKIYELIEKQKYEFDYSIKETAIILAAGHGKRIKSQTSKMLHKILEKPTVERVANACKKGLKKVNSIIVVGIKAADVIDAISDNPETVFAFQAEQNGTGHAVQIAVEKIKKDYDGTIYILPGDMGLIDSETISDFKNNFVESNADMMVLTGLFEGDSKENAYGRIVRVKECDVNGESSGDDFGKVIEIIEHKDILSLKEEENYITVFKDKKYSFTRNELIENNEFNSGVYAVNYKHLKKLLNSIESNNAQGEIYITDLISIFNNNGLTVRAVHPHSQHVLMGFNNKSVLLEMESIARKQTYEQIKDIIEIEAPDDFFIYEDVVNDIIELDKKGRPLDIKIGKGVYLGAGVKVNYNLTLLKNVYLKGNIHFGENVSISENAHLSTFKNQTMTIGDNSEILWGDIIKGNIKIGKNTRIESSVNMTGSDEYPVIIGNNVTIKGTSYIFGTVIDDDLFIEHSILINKNVDRVVMKNGEVKKIRFFLPPPEGIDSITELN
ncbi:MAG: NTP transferase domain-containing protein [Bacteroidetes bacterium]|nr:NTP transferase domain-containing protein [Bacteroidota bacterium]MBU1113985.1 NTP transferase domain-containing protein [Bacteroidota bacterium]MBU1800261.1 NTP transferase domain-containing protein [Bacteroidota bacterium]